jgi:hypothetical protein
MEFKIKKYTFFESYPSILKHKIPIITIAIFFTYLSILIFYWFKSIKYVIKFHKFQRTLKIDGPTSEINFPISVNSITNAASEKIIDLKSNTQKTSITFYKKGNESFEKVKELLSNGTIDDSMKNFLPSSKNFYLREDLITIIDKNYSGDVIFITKGYNIAVMKTLRIFSFLIKQGELDEYKISMRA